MAHARENIAFVPMITNVQDFVVNLERALVTPADKTFADEMELPEEEYVELESKSKENEEGGLL